MGVAITATGNFRDLGGLPASGGTVREGLLMRSDALTDVTPAGLEALGALGLQTIVDLREPVERNLHPNALDGLAVRVREQPLFDGLIDMAQPRGLEELYLETLDVCGRQFARVVSVLCEPGALPALLHCSAGKDRTGLACAILLGAIGVAEAAIVEDYARSEAGLRGPTRERAKRRALAAGMREQLLAQNFGSPPDVMRRALEHLDRRHGGALAYLRRHGVSGDLEALRDALVAPYGDPGGRAGRPRA